MSLRKKLILMVAAMLLMVSCQLTDIQPTAQPGPTQPPAVSPTPALPPSPPPTAQATAAPTATSVPPGAKIDAQNASLLKQVAQASFDNPARLIWSPDSTILTVISNQKLERLDARTLQNKGSVEFTAPIVLLDFSADGHTMASTSNQATVELRDVTSGKTQTSLSPTAPFNSLAFSPDGQTLALTSVDEIAATLWKVDGGQQIAKLSGFQTAAPVYDVSFTPDGKSLVWHARALVQLMDISNQKLGPAFEHEDFVSALSVSSDGSRLATSAGGTLDGNFIPLVYVWDTAGGKNLAKLKPGDVCTALQFLAGSHLLAGGSGSQVVLWDADSQQQLVALQGHGDRVSAVAFSPDGKLLASASADNTVRLWQVKP